MPAVAVTAARGANRCGGAGSGLGCCAMAQSGLGTGRQRHRDGGSLCKIGAAVMEAALDQVVTQGTNRVAAAAQ